MSENFEELIEQYWDEKSVEEKINNDEQTDEEEVVKYDSRIDSPFGVADEISINDFVNEYLNIKGNYTKLRHFELKNMNCPYVIGVSNEFADLNPAFVKQKKYLVIVIDHNGNRGTYVNPVLVHEYFNYDYKEAKNELKQTLVGFENIDEFFNNFIRVKAEYEAYNEFFKFIQEAKKVKKFKSIENYENILGDDNDDKHKRK